MSGHHEKIGQNEIFVGNTERSGDRVAWLMANGVGSARLGSVAYCITGKPLPEFYAPVIIRRSDHEIYDRVMMEKTFGKHWRRP